MLAIPIIIGACAVFAFVYSIWLALNRDTSTAESARDGAAQGPLLGGRKTVGSRVKPSQRPSGSLSKTGDNSALKLAGRIFPKSGQNRHAAINGLEVPMNGPAYLDVGNGIAHKLADCLDLQRAVYTSTADAGPLTGFVWCKWCGQDHVCQPQAPTCTCWILNDAPSDDCPIHSGAVMHRRCDCGRFVRCESGGRLGGFEPLQSSDGSGPCGDGRQPASQ
jgi:hypothetical protein